MYNKPIINYETNCYARDTWWSYIKNIAEHFVKNYFYRKKWQQKAPHELFVQRQWFIRRMYPQMSLFSPLKMRWEYGHWLNLFFFQNLVQQTDVFVSLINWKSHFENIFVASQPSRRKCNSVFFLRKIILKSYLWQVICLQETLIYTENEVVRSRYLIFGMEKRLLGDKLPASGKFLKRKCYSQILWIVPKKHYSQDLFCEPSWGWI